MKSENNKSDRPIKSAKKRRATTSWLDLVGAAKREKMSELDSGISSKTEFVDVKESQEGDEFKTQKVKHNWPHLMKAFYWLLKKARDQLIKI